ncbi:MAG: M20 family metallopeptidase [Desulfobacteraceae bacterium]
MNKHLDAVELTTELIRYNTINPPGKERACARYIGRLLEEGGFRVHLHEFAPERTSLIATMGGDGIRPPICFTGHMDTVPLGSSPWNRAALKGDRDEQKVYGRGASDMKSGLAAMIKAAMELAGGLERSPGVMLVITAGEETGCEGAKYVAGLNRAMGNAGALVVGEPTANYPMLGHKGCLWIEVHTRGVTAHGSMPEKGVNAIYKAARAVTRLEELDFDVQPDPLLGRPTLNVGTISGGMNINSVPDKAVLSVDIRTILGQDHDMLCDRLQAYLGADAEVVKVLEAESILTEPENEWIQDTYDLITPFLQERPHPRTVTYFTDASILTPALGGPPTILLGPGEPDMAHKADEFCHVSRIETASALYTEIIRKWCGI